MNKQIFDYIKLLTSQDKKTLSQKTLKALEELGELARVVLPFEGADATNHRFVERQQILEEVADTMLSVISVTYDLNFSDEELEDMMWKKANKWSVLQAKQTKGQFPLPFEIHVTVSGSINVARFKNTCKQLNVKPVLIDMQDNSGDYIFSDVMTSSKHFGTNTTAWDEMNRIVRGLMDDNFEIIRKKIETVPWHPGAPSTSDELMPPDCYFEAHLGVVVDTTNQHRMDILKAIASVNRAHLSKNTFKKVSDTEHVLMLTKRSYNSYNEEFKFHVDTLLHHLTVDGFTVQKPIIEFAIYDSKINHDASWIAPNG